MPARRSGGRRQPARAGDLLYGTSGRADPFPAHAAQTEAHRRHGRRAGRSGLCLVSGRQGLSRDRLPCGRPPSAAAGLLARAGRGGGRRPGCRMGGPGPPGRALRASHDGCGPPAAGCRGIRRRPAGCRCPAGTGTRGIRHGRADPALAGQYLLCGLGQRHAHGPPFRVRVAAGGAGQERCPDTGTPGGRCVPDRGPRYGRPQSVHRAGRYRAGGAGPARCGRLFRGRGPAGGRPLPAMPVSGLCQGLRLSAEVQGLSPRLRPPDVQQCGHRQRPASGQQPHQRLRPVRAVRGTVPREFLHGRALPERAAGHGGSRRHAAFGP